DAARGENDGIRFVRWIQRRPVLDGVHAGTAVGVREAAAFKQTWRTGMIDRRAWPEHPEVLLDLLVRDAGIVGDSAARGAPQFLKDLLRRAEVEETALAQSPRQIADNLPVAPGFAGGIDRLADADDAALRTSHGPLVFLLK